MKRSAQIADLSQPVEWRRGDPYYKGKLVRYDDLAARLYASELEIQRLQSSVENHTRRLLANVGDVQ